MELCQRVSVSCLWERLDCVQPLKTYCKWESVVACGLRRHLTPTTSIFILFLRGIEMDHQPNVVAFTLNFSWEKLDVSGNAFKCGVMMDHILVFLWLRAASGRLAYPSQLQKRILLPWTWHLGQFVYQPWTYGTNYYRPAIGVWSMKTTLLPSVWLKLVKTRLWDTWGARMEYVFNFFMNTLVARLVIIAFDCAIL